MVGSVVGESRIVKWDAIINGPIVDPAKHDAWIVWSLGESAPGAVWGMPQGKLSEDGAEIKIDTQGTGLRPLSVWGRGHNITWATLSWRALLIGVPCSMSSAKLVVQVGSAGSPGCRPTMPPTPFHKGSNCHALHCATLDHTSQLFCKTRHQLCGADFEDYPVVIEWQT